MICQPCQEPHQPEDCIDHVAQREYPLRHCVCQHKPRLVIDVTFTENDTFPPIGTGAP
ncbi:hypothetical protein DFJ65_3415 [Calidifontibacter indicus]|uniref:Uncharacterized protein n=1 Tax=Calidifontibacter indicus TaxID=419650 RepID=A0A3D9U5F3_9MICO|nr:hypothetical protein DFJ65_3415 [Calidifontibacter indicus]